MAEKITGTTVNRVRRGAKPGRSVEIHDLVQPGLSIRATGRGIKWYFRYSTAVVRDNGNKVRTARPICSVDACPDVDRMRQVAAAGRAALQDGRDPLAAVRTALAQVLGLPDTRVAGAPSVQTWDFPTLRQEFRRKPPSHMRKDTVEGYYRALSSTQVGEAIYAKRLVEITAADIRHVRDSIEERGHDRQAQLTLQALRTVFTWATESPRSALSGLTEDTNPTLLVVSNRRCGKPTKEDAIATADRVRIDDQGNLVIDDPKLPTVADLGKLLLLLLDPTKLPLVKRAILLLLTYTVQRRLTVASALRKTLLWVPQFQSACWVLDGGTTKAGRPHILPFSENAWHVVEAWAQSLPQRCDWLFPGMATGRKPIPSGHIDVRTVDEWMYEACNLAGCSRQHSPHSVRKAFGTYLSKKGVAKEDRKRILDHAEGRGSDVTEVHYNFDPMLDNKQATMEIWNKFLDECIHLAQKQLEPELPTAVSSAGSASADIAKPAELTLPEQVPHSEPTTMVGAKGSIGPRATDPARLEALRAKLDANRQLEDNIARTLRKRP